MDNMDNMDTMDDSTGSPAVYAVRLYMDSARLPTVLRACSPQRHMTTQTAPDSRKAAKTPKTKEATGKRKHTGLPTPSSLLSKNLRKSA
ncbi:MAG: hypothetical protein ACOX9E_01760 [Lentisphaeria bacterium]|jgi:hypothetical protein